MMDIVRIRHIVRNGSVFSDHVFNGINKIRVNHGYQELSTNDTGLNALVGELSKQKITFYVSQSQMSMIDQNKLKEVADTIEVEVIDSNNIADLRTRIVELALPTVIDNAYSFNSFTIPTKALTMGTGTIMGAREIILLANGPSKTTAVVAAVEGPITSSVQASYLQEHENVTFIVDLEAGEKLKLGSNLNLSKVHRSSI